MQPLVWSHNQNRLNSKCLKKKKATKHSFKGNHSFLKQVNVVWKWKHYWRFTTGWKIWHLWGVSPDRLIISRNNLQDMNVIDTQKRRSPVSSLEKRLMESIPCLQPKGASRIMTFQSPVITRSLRVFFQINSKIKVSSKHFHTLLMEVEVDILIG